MLPPINIATSDHQSVGRLGTGHWLARFSDHARSHSERTALVAGRRSITFGELDSWSDRIACGLQQAGIQAGQYVGTGFHRSTELMAGLLGVLKSGAAYVPLDPAYPAGRIQQMLASAGIQTVLTTRALAGSFPGVRTLSVDDFPICKVTTPVHAQENNAPVYAIFTSGSTGQPKAASVFHPGFANLLDWYGRELALTPSDRTLVISSPSFDLTQKNLFTPLLTGGLLVLDDCGTYDISHILQLIKEHEITLINCTPSAFYPVADAAASEGYAALASLRFAVLGGEAISIPRLRPWLQHSACRAEVVNSYGPTECTDICLFHRLRPDNIDEFSFVPLGREIPNVVVTIRDESLTLLADGEIGELCIGGAGVGGGYLNDPARTMERFVGGLYRTGDLAKRLPCGTFEFRGRADHQVKVNGFRIELGEIEIALNRHDAVREAVVTMHENKLTAHVQGSASREELRCHLSAQLPAYMIPAEFLFVKSFPLTPNGKVDRMALDHPSDRSNMSDAPDTPAHSFESRILTIWSDVLGHKVTDSSANFFDLGGSSIHLAIVHVRLRELIGRDFPITDLFALPNVRAIAKHLSPDAFVSPTHNVHDRAILAKSGFARFQRPRIR